MISKLEMFQRAVRGLASQDWQRAEEEVRPGGLIQCRYETSDGRRCAWGWVDPSLGTWNGGSVAGLHSCKYGLAGELDLDSLNFAEELQDAHDRAGDDNMRERFFNLIDTWTQLGLTWPEDVA